MCYETKLTDETKPAASLATSSQTLISSLKNTSTIPSKNEDSSCTYNTLLGSLSLDLGSSKKEEDNNIMNDYRFAGLRKLLEQVADSDSSSEVASALMDINDLLLQDVHSAKMARAACALEAPSILVSCMKKWLHQEEIQDWSLWCLHRLVSSCAGAGMDINARRAILARGGVQVMVSALKLFPNAADIQRGGFLALAGTISDPSSCEESKALVNRLVQEWAGVEWILSVITKWPQDAPLQEAAIGLLNCLSSSSQEARLLMIHMSAVELVAVAVQAFPVLKEPSEPFMKTMLKTMLFHTKAVPKVSTAVAVKGPRRPSATNTVALPNQTKTRRHTVPLMSHRGRGASAEC